MAATIRRSLQLDRAPQLDRAARSSRRTTTGLTSTSGRLGGRVRRSLTQDAKGRLLQQNASVSGAPDVLALVRRMNPSLRSVVSVKAGTSVLNVGWDKYWAELRGNVVALFDVEAQNWAGSDGDPVINYVFCAIGCVVSRKKGSLLKIYKKKVGIPVFLKFSTDADCEKWFITLTKISAQRTVTVEDFDFVAPIGKGASGKVFLVSDKSDGSKYALKAIEKKKIFEHKSAFRHSVDERAALETVKGHPFFIQVRYAFQTRNTFYLVTDFYQGGDLFQYLKSNGCLHEREAKNLMAELILAFEYLHAKNVVYRDLKPENILIDEGHIRIADFGLCKRLTKSKFNGMTSTICGTFTYAAPEMLAVKHYGLSVDLWTLGIFIYHVLRGKTPFEAKDLEQVIHNMNHQPVQFPPGLSKQCIDFIKGLLEWRPENRIGCTSSGISDLKSHVFFEGVDFDAIYKRQPNPNLLYEIESKNSGKDSKSELRNFDMSEWSSVSIEKETEEELEFNDLALWPPLRASEIPDDDMFLAGYILGSL